MTQFSGQAAIQTLIQRARAAHARGDFARSVTLCDGLLARAGPIPEVLNLKIISLMAQGKYEIAEPFVHQALKAAPGVAGLQANAAVVLDRLIRPREARRHALEAMRLAPREAAVLYPVANVLRNTGDYEQSLGVTQRILQIEPNFSDAWHLQASLEMDLGKLEAAADSLARTIELEPANTRALSTLVKLRGSTLADIEIVSMLERMHSGQQDTWDPESATFALAGLHHRSHNYDQAFTLYREANTSVSVRRPFDLELYERGVEMVIQATLQDDYGELRKASPVRDQGGDLVFIIGMPRSGTTLCEQIVSSHSAVLASGELETMEQIEQGLERVGVNPALASGPQAASTGQMEQARLRYRSVLPHGHEKFHRVLDKAPLNFQRLSFIHRMFPAARFLYCQRHPLDTILSCYFHDFLGGMNFTFDLHSLTRVYIAHTRLMSHWMDLLADNIQSVAYPEMVGCVEKSARGMAEFLGLEFEPSMTLPHLNTRPVTTASSAQVREPIHQKGLDVWKHYESHLQETISELEQAGCLPFHPGTHAA